MSRPPCRRSVFVAVVLAVALAGCQSDYHGQSILLSDGGIERTILQPLEDTPATAQKPELWQSKEVVKYSPRPGVEPRDYVKARGKFASVQNLPDTLAIRPGNLAKVPKLLLPASKLRRHYEKLDYVFVTDHRWSETVVDTVTLASLRQGREELATLGISLGQDIFNDVLGPWYDATELVKWLRTDGKAWLADLTDYVFIQFLTDQKKAPQSLAYIPEEFLNGLVDICARYGLQLRENGKRITDDAKLQQVWDDFLINLVQQKVRRKDTGKPVDRDTVRGWLEELNGPKKAANAGPNRFEVAARKIIKDRYGGETLLNINIGLSLLKVTGVFWIEPLVDRVFDYSLTLPGEVVETNGQVLSGNRVRWQFTGHSAWPLGYAMRCRSLEARSQLQQDLLRGQPLQGREAMLDFVALLAKDRPSRSREHPPLLELLKECRTQKRLTPLYDHRQTVETRKDKQRLAQLDALFKLLDLPLERSDAN